jgi:hypothetical protein
MLVTSLKALRWGVCVCADCVSVELADNSDSRANNDDDSWVFTGLFSDDDSIVSNQVRQRAKPGANVLKRSSISDNDTGER